MSAALQADLFGAPEPRQAPTRPVARATVVRRKLQPCPSCGVLVDGVTVLHAPDCKLDMCGNCGGGPDPDALCCVCAKALHDWTQCACEACGELRDRAADKACREAIGTPAMADVDAIWDALNPHDEAEWNAGYDRYLAATEAWQRRWMAAQGWRVEP